MHFVRTPNQLSESDPNMSKFRKNRFPSIAKEIGGVCSAAVLTLLFFSSESSGFEKDPSPASHTPAAPAAEVQSTDIKLTDAEVQLPSNAATGTDSLIIHTGSRQVPVVAESGPPGPSLQLSQATPFGAVGLGDWILPVTVTNFPSETTQTRYLIISAGNVAATLPFTVQNAGKSFSWTVLPLGGNFSWGPASPLMMTVLVGPVPATHLTASSTLTDDVTGERFAATGMDVCSNPKAPCTPIETLDAKRPYTLYLLPKAGVSPRPGKFAGALQLIAAEGKGDAATLTVMVTSGWYKLAGVLALMIGVILSFAFTVGVRNGLARAHLRMPAATLRETFERLRANQMSLAEAPKTLRQIDCWLGALTGKALEDADFLPGWFSVSAINAQASPNYQALLDKAGRCLAILDRIIGAGLLQVRDAMKTHSATNPPDPVADRLQRAWNTIDALSDNAARDNNLILTVAEVDQRIANELTAMNSDIASLSNGQADPATLTPAANLQSIRFEIKALSLLSWIVVASLTSVVGIYVMVLSHLDFGRCQDFINAFLWGFGLPAAGSQLSQLTPTTIGAAFGVVRPT